MRDGSKAILPKIFTLHVCGQSKSNCSFYEPAQSFFSPGFCTDVINSRIAYQKVVYVAHRVPASFCVVQYCTQVVRRTASAVSLFVQPYIRFPTFVKIITIAVKVSDKTDECVFCVPVFWKWDCSPEISAAGGTLLITLQR